ncbi:N-succinylarginine dihydrolase [Mucisphaera sp.]|uniref:N-succinylarginine dihydrolase n=1 Tax=Mucisphaera sp. TaxID=2913024 RepID=UPI003D0E90FC
MIAATKQTTEVQFDGLVGPTHNYAGLAPGNLASQSHQGLTSSPKIAALQGLAKAKALADLGIPQAILPPHPRPNLSLLRRLGFTGDDANILATAHRHAPDLLAAASSASPMWTANAATISPSPDTADNRLHLTPANLTSALHRSIEAPFTTHLLKQIFTDDSHFAIHDPLPASLPDEGAANHTRLSPTHDQPALELFVYGSQAPRGTLPNQIEPKRFSARQHLASSQAIARLHQLNPDHALFIQQHPEAIDAGVFHNDVIAVGDTNLLLLHEKAFLNQQDATDQIATAYQNLTNDTLTIIIIREDQVSLKQAVDAYLFNSQLLRTPDGKRLIVCPDHCRQTPAVANLLNTWQQNGTFDEVLFFDLHQSMSNGGGPACLRLRITLTPEQQNAIPHSLYLTPTLHEQLTHWINHHYSDQLTPNDLADPQLIRTSKDALDQLSRILNLPNLYKF